MRGWCGARFTVQKRREEIKKRSICDSRDETRLLRQSAPVPDRLHRQAWMGECGPNLPSPATAADAESSPHLTSIPQLLIFISTSSYLSTASNQSSTIAFARSLASIRTRYTTVLSGDDTSVFTNGCNRSLEPSSSHFNRKHPKNHRH